MKVSIIAALAATTLAVPIPQRGFRGQSPGPLSSKQFTDPIQQVAASVFLAASALALALDPPWGSGHSAEASSARVSSATSGRVLEKASAAASAASSVA